MAVLFVVGVMNLLWIAALMVIVLLAKVVPGGRYFARFTGCAALAAGTWMLKS
jgi:predicted metal-binding membrane protein